ncbi:hypothetical protein HPB48_010632 [Haemaphysalis longicornis]|uniref:Peptidase M13 C-terminal domain-containing protein n=1 Tax=Haemaphysalis longicornis TaxID=44386 RepID=A0A9J6FZL9_HAELO|nr:hypothetical protein HPB48_010632 [Haemaphysalis longicornis]
MPRRAGRRGAARGGVVSGRRVAGRPHPIARGQPHRGAPQRPRGPARVRGHHARGAANRASTGRRGVRGNRQGGFHKKPSMQNIARDDMHFANRSRRLSSAIADALESSSRESDLEYVQGAPLEVEARRLEKMKLVTAPPPPPPRLPPPPPPPPLPPPPPPPPPIIKEVPPAPVIVPEIVYDEAPTELDEYADAEEFQEEKKPVMSEEVQVGPMKLPVASYLVKRPRPKGRLERFLSLFGLAAPDEADTEVVEYEFYDPPEHRGKRKTRKKNRRFSGYDEFEESSESEPSADERDAYGREKEKGKRRRREKDKQFRGRDQHEGTGRKSTRTEKPGKPGISGYEAGANPLIPGYVEEVTEEVVEPRRGPQGENSRTHDSKDSVCAALVRPAYKNCGTGTQRTCGYQQGTEVVAGTPSIPSLDFATWASNGFSTSTNAATTNASSTNAVRIWSAYYAPPGHPVGGFSYAHRPLLPVCGHVPFRAGSTSSVCTCVVKCGDHCIGQGRKRSSSLGYRSLHTASSDDSIIWKDRRLSEDASLCLREEARYADGLRIGNLEARFRVEEEMRRLRSNLRLFGTNRQDVDARCEEMREEEEALRRERQLLEDELNRLKERKQAGELRQQHAVQQQQISLILDRLQVLEQAHEERRRQPATATGWGGAPANPFFMPLPWAPGVPYGYSDMGRRDDMTSGWWRRPSHRGRPEQRCSDAGSKSTERARETPRPTAAMAADIPQQPGETSEEPEKTSKHRFLGGLIPFFTSSAGADKWGSKHVSYAPAAGAEIALNTEEQSDELPSAPSKSKRNEAETAPIVQENTVFNTAKQSDELPSAPPKSDRKDAEAAPIIQENTDSAVPDVVLVRHRDSFTCQGPGSPSGAALRGAQRIRPSISSEIDDLVTHSISSASEGYAVKPVPAPRTYKPSAVARTKYREGKKFSPPCEATSGSSQSKSTDEYSPRRQRERETPKGAEPGTKPRWGWVESGEQSETAQFTSEAERLGGVKLIEFYGDVHGAENGLAEAKTQFISQHGASNRKNESPLPMSVRAWGHEEMAAEKETFLMTESSPQIFQERKFVTVISILALVWIALALSTGVFPVHDINATQYFTCATTTTSTHATSTRTRAVKPTVLREAYLCDSEYCVNEGNFIKSLLSHAVGPCEDFYQYVCERWQQRRKSDEPPRAPASSEDALLQELTERDIASWAMEAGRLKSAPTLLTACEDSVRAFSSFSLTLVRRTLEQWRIKEWPVPTYKDRSREDVWLFAGELVRDLDLAVFAHVYEHEYQRGPVLTDVNALDAGVWKLARTALDRRTERGARRKLQDGERVILLSKKYFSELPEELLKINPSALLNHLGFRAIVRLAPFMPESLSKLRQLSSVEATDRFDEPEVQSLCIRAIERALPLCLAKASTESLLRSDPALGLRHWLSDIGNIFLRAVPRVSWVDERALFILAFRLRRIAVGGLFLHNKTLDDSTCTSAYARNDRLISKYLQLFRNWKHTEAIRKLGLGLDRRAVSPLTSWPTWDLLARRVHVPVGLINNSVPANSSIFAFHLSRVAVRLYSAMVPILVPERDYDLESSMDLGGEARRRFAVDRDCFDNDWKSLATQEEARLPLYSLLDPGAGWLRRRLLEQTLAIELSLHAFRQLVDMRRVWKLEYRYLSLPEVSSVQLFFLYYAIDNCERDDARFQLRQLLLRRRPPAAMRVNLPLRHVRDFSDAFGCNRGDFLRADMQCSTFRA